MNEVTGNPEKDVEASSIVDALPLVDMVHVPAGWGTSGLVKDMQNFINPGPNSEGPAITSI